MMGARQPRKISTEVGADDDKAWNDRHLQHAFIWLTSNPNSPYKGSPAMLLTAMGVAKVYREDFRRALLKGCFYHYRFGVRLAITAAFQKVLAGQYEPVVLKRNKNGLIIKFEIKPAVNPQPLPCPPFYKGGIRITTRGLLLSLKRTEAQMAPMHDPHGRERLTNPFGKI